MTLEDYIRIESGISDPKWWDCARFVFKYVAPEVLEVWPKYDTRREALEAQKDYAVIDAKSYRDKVAEELSHLLTTTDSPNPGDIAVMDALIPAMGLVTKDGGYFKAAGGGLQLIPMYKLRYFLTRIENA